MPLQFLVGCNVSVINIMIHALLGYGDVTPLKEWRLVGPITAMNGILMFGWSTAVLFEVLRKTIEHLALIVPSEEPFNSADPD